MATSPNEQRRGEACFFMFGNANANDDDASDVISPLETTFGNSVNPQHPKRRLDSAFSLVIRRPIEK